MKKCSEIKELISLYIDDELEVDERREFEEHMDSCEECRNELDELEQIVGLCRTASEEELPADFRIELHQKLLEVQKQTKEAVKPMFYRTKYFKLFSSVAAVFLLVFLIKGFYNFDLFSNGKTSQSADRADMRAEAAPETEMQMKSGAMPETANDTGNSVEKSIEGLEEPYFDANNGTQAAGTEIDRSTAGGRNAQMGAFVVTAGESVTRNTTSITIIVDDPDTQVENIKAVAEKSSGLELQAIQLSDTVTMYTTEADGNVVLQLNIPTMQLNAFMDALNTDYGQSNVQQEAAITEDMSVAMEELLKQSDNLDIEIEKMESSDNASTNDLDKLKEQKTEIQNKIDTIRLESDLTNVKVILKKK